MPILIRDITWKQTETSLTIYVPTKGVCPSKIDVFTSVQYLKLSFSPFFFEVLLLEPIDINKSSCTKTQQNTVFELVKADPKIWNCLECNLTKKEKKELKLKCIDEEFKRTRQVNEEKENKKHELKRVAVREAISIDTKERKFIENIKENEKVTALGSLQEWQDKLVGSHIEEKIKEINDTESESESEEEEPLADVVHRYISKPPEEPKPEPPKEKINEVRKCQTLSVSFTERVFPTPCRESRMDEENEWLKKQAEARRSVGFVSEDLRPEEKNPQFLQSKGEEFSNQGNFLGAISAYTFGIKLSPNYSDLYIGRSEAHFAAGNFQRCTEDCSTALELMVPAVQANLKQRATCIHRRGICLFKLGYMEKGISELRAALRLQPENEEIRKDMEKLQDEWDDMSD